MLCEKLFLLSIKTILFMVNAIMVVGKDYENGMK